MSLPIGTSEKSEIAQSIWNHTIDNKSGYNRILSGFMRKNYPLLAKNSCWCANSKNFLATPGLTDLHFSTLNPIDSQRQSVIQMNSYTEIRDFIVNRNHMFAVVRTGGKQYCVKPGDVLKVEKIEAEPSSKISLTDVVLTSSDKGEVAAEEAEVAGAVVSAEVLKHVRNKKVIIFKKKRRHNYRRKNGHRQWMTVLKITDISLAK